MVLLGRTGVDLLCLFVCLPQEGYVLFPRVSVGFWSEDVFTGVYSKSVPWRHSVPQNLLKDRPG